MSERQRADQSWSAIDDTRWHAIDEDLAAYVAGTLRPPMLWSVEAHLFTCDSCRDRLAAAVGAAPTDAGWSRLDLAMDVPRPGAGERLLTRLGLPEHVARILAVTPALRLSWLCAVAVTLALTAMGSQLATALREPLPFLALAPLVPLLGVAVSFRAGIDPTHEIGLVAPMSSFRLAVVRSVVVLGTSVLIAGAASLALPRFGLLALGWLLPALALTALSLLLMPRLGVLLAPAAAGGGWLVLLGAAAQLSAGTPVVFTAAGQASAAAVAVLTVLGVALLRERFDINRHLNPSGSLTSRSFT